MSVSLPGPLVTVEWLITHLHDGDVRILDCTWHHPSTHLDGRNQYRGRHIPNAVHFDIDHIADPKTDLPHMLPSPADFAKKVGLLGVGRGDRVIVYDRMFGSAAAARVWWMFRVFGYDNVALLDGGLSQWIAAGAPTEMSSVRPQPATFEAAWRPGLVATLDAMIANLTSSDWQIIDARGPQKFDGSQPDVFPFIRRGHIPCAINVPWADLLDPKPGTFFPPQTLRARFLAASIDLEKPIVTMCASGITSGMIVLALYLIGRRDVALFDGSWAQWEQADGRFAVA